MNPALIGAVVGSRRVRKVRSKQESGPIWPPLLVIGLLVLLFSLPYLTSLTTALIAPWNSSAEEVEVLEMSFSSEIARGFIYPDNTFTLYSRGGRLDTEENAHYVEVNLRTKDGKTVRGYYMLWGSIGAETAKEARRSGTEAQKFYTNYLPSGIRLILEEETFKVDYAEIASNQESISQIIQKVILEQTAPFFKQHHFIPRYLVVSVHIPDGK